MAWHALGPRRRVIGLLTIVAMAAVVLAEIPDLSRAHADREDFVGSATCGGCHPTAFTIHQAGAHANAGAAVRAARLRTCDRCHRMGDAPLGDSYFDEVGCESCHGAGAAYATDDIMRDPQLARLLGLADLRTQEARQTLCISCHREPSTRRLPFDFESAYKRIEHQ